MDASEAVNNLRQFERFSVTELWKLPTLAEGQAEDLKVDEGAVRYWLTRVGLEDGQDAPIGVEVLIGGKWREVHRYGSWDEYMDCELDDEPDEDDE